MPIRFRAAIAIAVALLVAPGLVHAQATAKAPAARKTTPAKPAASPTIATVLGQNVTRADLGPAPPGLVAMAAGDAAKKKSLETRWEGQALTGLVLGTLLDRYAAGKKVEATPAELSELMRLAVAGARTPEAIKAGTAPPDTNNAQYRMAAAGVVARFKINAALYKEYGGTVVIDPQAGPMPLGSYRSFLEARQKAGAFTIVPTWKQRFWAAFTLDPQQPVVPPADAAAMMRTPWWRDGKK